MQEDRLYPKRTYENGNGIDNLVLTEYRCLAVAVSLNYKNLPKAKSE